LYFCRSCDNGESGGREFVGLRMYGRVRRVYTTVFSVVAVLVLFASTGLRYAGLIRARGLGLLGFGVYGAEARVGGAWDGCNLIFLFPLDLRP